VDYLGLNLPLMNKAVASPTSAGEAFMPDASRHVTNGIAAEAACYGKTGGLVLLAEL
jgi:hypothetical protein